MKLSNQSHTKRDPRYDGPYGCSVGATLSVIGGRWKPRIIFQLMETEVLRFGQFRKAIPEVTQKILTAQLRELEEDKIISRKVYPEVPPRVEYRLTDYGKSLEPVMLLLRDWGADHIDKTGVK